LNSIINGRIAAIHIAPITGMKLISGWYFFVVFHYNSARAGYFENILQTQRF